MSPAENRVFKRIRLYTSADTRRWAEEFRCSEAQLREAVAAVGNSYSAVRVYLDRALETSWEKTWREQGMAKLD